LFLTHNFACNYKNVPYKLYQKIMGMRIVIKRAFLKKPARLRRFNAK
jgi:hypothetical protein